MFEHIYFHTHESQFETTEQIQRIQSEAHSSFVDENLLPPISDADYYLEGKVLYLLQKPLPPKKTEKFCYMQSFSYTDSVEKFYTTRKNYDSLLLLYTYDGCGKLEYRDKTYTLGPGDFFLIDCRESQRYYTAASHWRHADLHIWGGCTEYLWKEIFSLREPVMHCKEPERFQGLLENILRLHNSILQEREFCQSVEIENLLRFLMQCDARSEKNNQIPENIHYLQVYLEHHFTENLSLDEMANFAGLSKYHLCREFKRVTKFSPKEYLIHLRLLQANQLLQTTHIPCYKIGQLVGFDNEANFIRHFKQTFAMTPGEFRKINS